jgi:hypothetical protein
MTRELRRLVVVGLAVGCAALLISEIDLQRRSTSPLASVCSAKPDELCVHYAPQPDITAAALAEILRHTSLGPQGAQCLIIPRAKWIALTPSVSAQFALGCAS